MMGPIVPQRPLAHFNDRIKSTMTKSDSTALNPARPGVSPLKILAIRIKTGMSK